MKTQLKNFAVLLIVFFAIVPIGAKAQKGTVKIFSELKGIIIFLDEVNQGTDIVNLDSITTGTHYLKIIKDGTIVYGELITVNTNSVTTVLVKKSKDVQEKLLANKYEEQQKYKNMKLGVILSTKYVTTTSGHSSSSYFPGYYIITGTSYGNTYSSTEKKSDWFITQGGSKKISEYSLAKSTGSQDVLKTIADINEEIARKNRKILRKRNTGLIFFLIGTVAILVSGADLLLAPFLSAELSAGIMTGGILFGIIGYSKGNVNSYSYPQHYISLDKAIKLTQKYNQDLKKSLGLPKNYEI